MPEGTVRSSTGPESSVPAAASGGGGAVAGQGRESGLEGFFPDTERLIELGVSEDERCQYTDAVRVDAGLEQQQPALGGRLDDRGRCVGVRLLASGLLDELDRQHRAESADVADPGPALPPRFHPSPNRLAKLSSAL